MLYSISFNTPGVSGFARIAFNYNFQPQTFERITPSQWAVLRCIPYFNSYVYLPKEGLLLLRDFPFPRVKDEIIAFYAFFFFNLLYGRAGAENTSLSFCQAGLDPKRGKASNLEDLDMRYIIDHCYFTYQPVSISSLRHREDKCDHAMMLFPHVMSTLRKGMRMQGTCLRPHGQIPHSLRN
ncbi:uncharacterized protein MCYG_02231 [Microsporum canis CBS 113480]|uniref:Uncharacterized protein n=1 Tax=Arthroderma otae (strain ATCC MYA-4605 / CBS 113480) TaxID=554155 RepID=C5FFG5_ARTOC|nr:uncharacterized protein MCYG_02231 [Microsporum canis CBS 113480]EEQ29412.1 predicted protein [Microsporum canis CBS 113480]